MDQTDLLQLKEVLENWQNHAPRTILAVLVQIIDQKFTYEQIIKARLYKSIKDLTQIDITKLPLLYSKHEYESVFLQAKTLHKLIMNLSQQPKLKRESSNTEEIIKTTPNSQINLFEGFTEDKKFYSSRGPVLIGLSRQILFNFQIANGNADSSQIDVDKIREITIGLEKELYFKNQFKSNPKVLYQQDVKTMLQFLKKDKSGSVTMRLLTTGFSVKVAASLKQFYVIIRSEDWIDDDTRKIQQEIQQQEMKAAQTGFYEDLKKREMGQAKGHPCRRCNKDTVYLMEEKQIRCADEPSTKFYECFNCNDRFRQN